ncbi:MAG TPA: hypothetical protein VKX49_18630 [Bryobacteraceae bacterium]|nr:hypothetical protein [Bryobacteraceae bacterium]
MKPLWLILAAVELLAQPAPLVWLNHNQPVLDAHNCYPYDGRWADRIDRALASGFPVSIEQDLTWDERSRRVVVTHRAEADGSEPALRDYFFERVRPIVEKALAENDTRRWPLIVLHFDFKSESLPLLQAVWSLLGEYQSWITTAPKLADPATLAPFDTKPILVITEDSDAQEQVFYKQLPAGARLRVFGSAHTARSPGESREERAHFLATLPPEKLLIDRPTNYRRWWNNSWYEVEEGGQTRAGDWTPADAERLRALVDRAHRLGYWIRFYTLDGFPQGDDHGWSEDYNFGSLEAARIRWRAAIAAGVDFIATDQYEDLGRQIKASSESSAAAAR